ncbi:MAG: RagB/SusD family nutrient uptake outer membrane protein [Flavobacteriaceae bacterium]
MKNKILITLMLVAVVFSCENALTKEPDFISEETIFEDENLTEAYLAEAYNSVPFQIMTGEAGNGMGDIGALGAEYTAFANWQQPNRMASRAYSADSGAADLTYWAYSNIRELNYFIEHIQDSESFSQDYIDSKLAEARFLRAFTYFEMAKRYGGVPIITKVQSEDDPEDELYPVRNTEKEVYDFIYNETNAVAQLFSTTKTGALGRADRYATLALQSRAMLYAASIAQFGEVQLDGVVGIPASDAQLYYKRSYDASQLVIDAGYVLYNQNPSDKVANLIALFQDEGNDEVIFAKVYEPFIKGHSLDNLSTPQGFNASWNSNFPVFYDIVEKFGFVEGSALTNVSRNQLTAANTWDINEFFGERDPRFRAAVFYPEYEWQSGTVYFHTSTTYTENGVTKTVTNRNTILDRNGEDWPAAAQPRCVRNTSLLLRKRLNESNLDPILDSSGQDYYIFRLGEILLNHAEAAYYLTSVDNQIALDDLNELRDRAGMPALTEVTEDNLRNERQVELAFEDHRYWDIVRWRTAEDELNGTNLKGLTFTYNLDTNRYTITLKNGESFTRAFGSERYYMPLSIDWIVDNPKLKQNPDYIN